MDHKKKLYLKAAQLERDSPRISSIDDFAHIVGMPSIPINEPIELEFVEETIMVPIFWTEK